MAMRKQLPFIELLREVVANKVDTMFHPATIHCKAFEDNNGAVEMAKQLKIRPGTKHLNNNYHHFQEHMQMGDMQIVAVKTDNQLADLLTKP